MVTWKRISELCETLTRSLKGDYSREFESYALVTATQAALHDWSDDRAINEHKSLVELLRTEESIGENESEQEMLLSAILDSRVRVVGRETTIASLLVAERREGYSDDPEKTLKDLGIRRIPFAEVQQMKQWQSHWEKGISVEESYVFFNTGRSGSIRRVLLRDTEHRYQNLATILVRLPGAFRASARVGSVAKGIMVPAGLMDCVDSKPWPTTAEVELPGYQSEKSGELQFTSDGLESL